MARNKIDGVIEAVRYTAEGKIDTGAGLQETMAGFLGCHSHQSG